MLRLHLARRAALAALSLLLCAGSAQAALEWIEEKAIPLSHEARDVAESPDGTRLFVLTSAGTIQVLALDGKLEATIPGPFTADRLGVSKDGRRLFLSGPGQKTLQVVSLLDRFTIDPGGSPFKGDAAAAVAVVVFSDFQ